ncbi:hypothetical protein D3C71_1757420 [compost metagenome]
MRRALISGSSVGPSAPQFHDRLLSVPSWLFSSLSSLCLSLYATRSRRVKPSWAVMKLTEAYGRRPRLLNMSPEAVMRDAKSANWPSSPFQNARAVSRKRSFHSAQPGAKLPTW